jgi:phage recombination protein Bet
MAVNNSLLKNNEEKQTMVFDVNGYEVKLNPAIVRKYLLAGNGQLTDQEIMYFMAMCKARQLNPFIREVHLIKYGSTAAQVVVGRDAYQKRATKHKMYNGSETGIWVERNDTGEIIKRNGSILSTTKETLLGSWCKVYRKDWEHPIEVEVNFNEYVGKKSDGTVNAQWSTKPVTMIVKVAESQALRKAFVEELGGMYEADELNINENDLSNEPVVVNEEPKVQESPKEEEEYNPFPNN